LTGYSTGISGNNSNCCRKDVIFRVNIPGEEEEKDELVMSSVRRHDIFLLLFSPFLSLLPHNYRPTSGSSGP
jgi:hypothetical protein